MHVNRPLSFVLVAAWLFLPSSVQTTSAAGRADSSAVVDLSTIRIDNFGRVDPNYFRGEQPEGRDYTDLAKIGVKTVIDLQADGHNQDEEQLVKNAGMQFYRIPMTTHVPPTIEQLAKFMGIVTDAARQPVYVHCAGGKHRTGVMTAVYRMERHGWTTDQAFKEMQQYKFGVSMLHPEFKKFVYEYRPLEMLRTQATPPSEASVAQPQRSGGGRQ
jgi:protein-tyrosine phosphatase